VSNQVFFQLPGTRAWKIGIPSVSSMWREKRYLFSTSGHGQGGTSPLPGSTVAQMNVCSQCASASLNKLLNSSTDLAPKAFLMPTPLATVTKSTPAAVAVFVPPDDSYTPLSKTTWTKFLGFLRIIVGKPHKFINSDPSPSSAMTLRCGNPRAIPSATEEVRPRVQHRRFPPLGR
jgi:hypothetical protein